MRRKLLIGLALVVGVLVVVGVIGAISSHHRATTNACVRRVLATSSTYTAQQMALYLREYPAVPTDAYSEIAAARFQCSHP